MMNDQDPGSAAPFWYRSGQGSAALAIAPVPHSKDWKGLKPAAKPRAAPSEAAKAQKALQRKATKAEEAMKAKAKTLQKTLQKAMKTMQALQTAIEVGRNTKR